MANKLSYVFHASRYSYIAASIDGQRGRSDGRRKRGRVSEIQSKAQCYRLVYDQSTGYQVYLVVWNG